MAVSLKTDLRFPESGQHGHGSRIIQLISSKTEKPQKPYGFRGILYLNIMSSCDNKSIFRLYYSMIVATFPDPTVRPPSRYQTGVLRCANDDFSCDLWGKIRIFRCVRVVFGDFVIMVLSYFLIPHLIISLFFTHKNSI